MKKVSSKQGAGYIMSEKPHRNLKVWQKAVELVVIIYKITHKFFPKSEIYGLSQQIRRAAVSIPSNLAEGAARKTRKEQLQFLYVARGSISELDTQLEIAFQLKYFDFKIFDEVNRRISEISKMLDGLIKFKTIPDLKR